MRTQKHLTTVFRPKSIGDVIREIRREQGENNIPERAARTLGIDVSRILGPGLPDDKLMVIHLEIMLSGLGGVTSTQLSEKYNVAVEPMFSGLSELKERISREPHLKIMISKLHDEFENDLKS